MKKIQHIKPFIIAIIFLMLVAIIGGIGTYYANAKSRSITTKTLPAISHLTLANQYRGQAFLHLIRAINTTDPAMFSIHEEQIQKFSDFNLNEFNLYKGSIQSQESWNLYNNLIQDRDNYVDCRKEILSLAKSGKISDANRQLLDRLLPLYENYLNKGQALVSYATTNANEQLHSIRLISILSLTFSIIASVSIFAFGFMMGYTR